MRQYVDCNIMKYIKRDIEDRIIRSMKPNKVVVLFGPRRVGKTYLIKKLIKKINKPHILYNGEDFAVREKLSRRTVKNYKNILGNKKYLFIDEAQAIPDIGRILKLMVDEIKGLKIIVSGSSSFDIRNMVGEPLTGRKYDFFLYPFSVSELKKIDNPIEDYDNLKERLVFGSYPEIVNLKDRDEKIYYLNGIINSYLLKDILAFENLKGSDKIMKLLQLVAYQVGGLVSYQKLGSKLGLSKNTVERYLNLLENVFVLYKLNGYARNLRKEITKMSKWYFLDNGIRNAIIANYNPIELRNDIGILWENYMISERLKYQSYHRMAVNNYFWRTYDKQEIDLIEERDGKLFAYEFKWKNKKSRIPAAWQKSYTDFSFQVFDHANYEDLIV